MNCPRCKAAIGPLANPDGVVTCPGCGSRLMTRAAMLRSQGAAKSGGADPGGTSAARSARDLPPDATLPATPAMMLALEAPAGVASEAPAAPADAVETAATIRVPGRKKGKPEPAPTSGGPADVSRIERVASAVPASPPVSAPAPASAAAPASASTPDALALVLRELREVRATQERILELLERSAEGREDAGQGEGEAASVSPIRVRRRKSVVLIDDDDATRAAAVAELTQAEVPVRAFADGNAAISAIAEEKPDVIALELGLAGPTEGRDVINMIKATMEWVEIPIVLWTREAVQGQREARQVHGADELVSKASGAAALVARVITLFRRVH